MKKYIKYILICLLLFAGISIYNGYKQNNNNNNNPVIVNQIDEDGQYTSKEEVSEYLITYNKLPSNFVTKSEAKKLGWVASEGNLQEVCENCSIGGDRYYNRENKLPDKDNRLYYECDIDYKGGTRNSKRLVYSNDGLIYYTDDHYKSFELLYGE